MQIVIDIDDNLYTRLFDNGVDNYDDAEDMATAIRKGTPLQSVEPERKTGKWIDYPFENVLGIKMYDYRCNLCAYFGNGKTKFCPNCGAKMEV